MTTLAFNGREPRAVSVSTDDDSFTVQLEDGRAISVPFVWSPRLANATTEQRKDFRMIGGGEGIKWPQIDEHLSVAGLLAGNPIRG
jgi:hypothetical protein